MSIHLIMIIKKITRENRSKVLANSDRKLLIDIIVYYYINQEMNLTITISKQLEKQILGLFTKEELVNNII